MWWYNENSCDWFFEETGSKELPVNKFGGCCGKVAGTDDLEDDESTATGGVSTFVGDSTSVGTDAVQAPVPTAVIGPMMPIDEDHCTHRAFYYNMYSEASGTHEPPNGSFGTPEQVD